MEYLDDPAVVMLDLEQTFSEEEVWEAIRSVPSEKAPGQYGFTGLFYKKCWDIIKGDVMAVMNRLFLLDGSNFHAINQTLITLIPNKLDAAENQGLSFY